jgi:hypothetical protein
MADNIVPLNNNEENIFEFELSIQGLNPKNIDAKFVIRSSEMDLSFPCTEGKDGKWQVKLPPLPMLEHTMYPYHFAIVAENHHFTPLEGSINVVGSKEVFVTTPKKKLTSPVKPIEEKKETPKIEVPKSQPTKSREKSIEQIANELMETKRPTAKPVEKAPALKVQSIPKSEVLTEQPKVESVKVEPVKVEPPKVEVKVEVTKPVVVESLLPKIAIEPKAEKPKGDKDDATRKVLEDMGIKTKKPKVQKRFSLKN